MTTPAFTAPYTYGEINLLRPVVLETAEQLRAAYPAVFAQAHNKQEPSGSAFANMLVHACRARGIRCALNGKRGGDTLSQDVINFPVSVGGVPDTARVVPGLVVIDFILAAGTPGQSIGWIDQTGPTLESAPGLGRWVEPRELDVPLPGAPGGETPAPPTPPAPPVPPAPPSAPPCGVDGAALLAQAHLTQAAAQRAAGAAADALAKGEDVYRLVADTLIDTHVSDILARLGRLEQLVEAEARSSGCALSRFR